MVNKRNSVKLQKRDKFSLNNISPQHIVDPKPNKYIIFFLKKKTEKRTKATKIYTSG